MYEYEAGGRFVDDIYETYSLVYDMLHVIYSCVCNIYVMYIHVYNMIYMRYIHLYMIYVSYIHLYIRYATC